LREDLKKEEDCCIIKYYFTLCVLFTRRTLLDRGAESKYRGSTQGILHRWLSATHTPSDRGRLL